MTIACRALELGFYGLVQTAGAPDGSRPPGKGECSRRSAFCTWRTAAATRGRRVASIAVVTSVSNASEGNAVSTSHEGWPDEADSATDSVDRVRDGPAADCTRSATRTSSRAIDIVTLTLAPSRSAPSAKSLFDPRHGMLEGPSRFPPSS